MKTLVYSLIMVILFILQTTVVAVFQMTKVKPDLPLIFSMCIIVIENEKIGSGMGLLNGILEDVFYCKLLGFNSMVKFLTNSILGYVLKNIYKGPIVITMGLVFLGTVIYNLLLLILSFMTGMLTKSWGFFVPITLRSALLNMIISPLIYGGTIRLMRFFDYYFDTKY